MVRGVRFAEPHMEECPRMQDIGTGQGARAAERQTARSELTVRLTAGMQALSIASLCLHDSAAPTMHITWEQRVPGEESIRSLHP